MKKPKGGINLSGASVGRLLDDEDCWPEPGQIDIDGFKYDRLAGNDTPKNAQKRIEWLRLQPTKDKDGGNVFYPQPYEHLAKVLRQMGHEKDARDVLIAKYDDMRESGTLDFGPYWRNHIMGFTIRHGYSPWRVVSLLLVTLLCGWYFFSNAYDEGVMNPAKEKVYTDANYPGVKGLSDRFPQYPAFNSFVYSLDALVPVLDLHQEDYWLPSASSPNGGLYRFYLWLHIIIGWVSSTMIVVYITGLVRKE